jgi:phage shock protein B
MGQGIFIVAIILGGVVLGLAVIGSTILMAIKLITGGVSRKSRTEQSEEARMIQEIYRGLTRMEERVEALETILLDRDRKERT